MINHALRIETLLLQAIKKYPAAPAISEWTGYEWLHIHYDFLLKRATDFSQQLVERQVMLGERVILMSRNRISAVAILLGIWMAKATVVLIDPDLPESVLADQIKIADVRFAVIEEEYKENINVEHLIIISDTGFCLEKNTVLVSSTVKHDCNENIAALVFTSGTTGHSKAVMLTHYNFIYLMEKYRYLAPPLATGITVWPLFHIAGLLCGILQSIFLNIHVVIFRVFSVEAMQQAFLRDHPVMLLTVPRLLDVMDKKIHDTISDKGIFAKALYIGLLKISYIFNRFFNINIGKLFFYTFYKKLGGQLKTIICGSAPLSLDVQKRFLSMGFELLCGYGLTETCGPITLSNRQNRWKLGSVGANKDISISDVGEVLYSGDALMMGYFREQKSGIDDRGSIFHTQDLGRTDLHGNLFIQGRLRELIIFSDGKKASPEQIEAQYKLIQNIEEFAVFSVEFHDAKIAVLAFVPTLNSNTKTTTQKIFQHASRLKSPYRIMDVMVVEKLPRSNALKVKRHELTDNYRLSIISNRQRITDHQSPITNHQLSIIECFQTILRKKKSLITPAITFAELGIDSLTAAQLTVALNQKLNLTLSPTIFWFAQNIDELSELIYSKGENVSENMNKNNINANQAIAIVSMDCVLPAASDYRSFWNNLVSGSDAIIEVPKSRFDIDDYYDPYPLAPGKTNSRWGGFINCINDFPIEQFNIKPRIAELMDPEQKILLMHTKRLLENYGCHHNKKWESWRDTKTGLFIGAGFSDFMMKSIKTMELKNVTPYTGVGMADFSAVGRVAYHFGFVGPALMIKTACSSSLIAVHQAMRALQCHDCDAAIAGGINMILIPEIYVCLTKGGFLSPDGRCKSFDAKANGYVRSEGCGLVLMKRYDDAVRDKDQILAVIVGSAINQDGASNGLTAPSGKSQVACYQEALEKASMHANQVGFVEAHGSGTQLGDAVEMESIQKVYDQKRDTPLFVGAVKSSIGHCEAAAGIAGLIKTIGVLNHRVVPPNLHYHTPNPAISFKNSSVVLPEKTVKFSGEYAAVSSFGVAGTNAHMILRSG